HRREYLNASISVVTSARRRWRIVRTALRSEKSLIRCAAHSDRISEPGMPHTFSVYERKNASYKRLPKRIVTHSSKLSALNARRRSAQRYESAQSVDSNKPRRPMTSFEVNG